MDIQTITNKEKKPSMVSARITKEDFDFIRKNEINVSNLIHEAIKDLKSNHTQEIERS